jgi:hypothetical protein
MSKPFFHTLFLIIKRLLNRRNHTAACQKQVESSYADCICFAALF